MEIPAALRDVSGTGTSVPLGDDQLSGPFPIGFSFEFYGVAFTVFRISSNGFITLGPFFQSDGCCSGGSIPAPFSPNNLIAAWWEDFNAPPGNIRFQTLGTPGSRELVVGFYDVPHFYGGPSATWEIVLHEDTNAIEIHCWSCPSDGGLHSVGIENGDGSIGLQIARTASSMPRIGWLLARGEPPDCSEARAEPDGIWPPDGQFAAVSVLGVTDADGDEVSIRINGVAQDEPPERERRRSRLPRELHGDRRRRRSLHGLRNDLRPPLPKRRLRRPRAGLRLRTSALARVERSRARERWRAPHRLDPALGHRAPRTRGRDPAQLQWRVSRS
jgi:hypothetical protein